MNKSESLVLFDIDGTLMRGAGPHHKNALVEGVRRITGLTTSLDGFPTQGMLDGDLLAAMLRAAGHEESAIQADLEAIAAESQHCYLTNCAEDLRPYVCVGVEQVLTELQKSGVVLGLVTGNFSAIGWKKVELAGLRSYFSVGAFAEDGTTRARLAKIALERAREAELLTDRFQVSLIGDHTNDIVAAKANGFQSIAVATGLMSLEELRAAQPDIAVRDLRELEIHRLVQRPTRPGGAVPC